MCQTVAESAFVALIFSASIKIYFKYFIVLTDYFLQPYTYIIAQITIDLNSFFELQFPWDKHASKASGNYTWDISRC